MRRKMLIEWLQDAHAMEMQSLPDLRRQIADPRESAAVRARLETHLCETERHLERVGQALLAVGGGPPGGGRGPRALDIGKNRTARLFSEPLVKKALMDVAAKQLEVAVYTAVIAAAEHAGEPEVARLCRLNRGEDEDMAEWLDAQIPILIVEGLAKVPRDPW